VAFQVILTVSSLAERVIFHERYVCSESGPVMIMKVDGPRAVGHAPRLETCDPQTHHDGSRPCFFALWAGRLRRDSGLYSARRLYARRLYNASRGRRVAQPQRITSSFLQQGASEGGWAHPDPYCGVHLHHSPSVNQADDGWA
jgi:hypothetical protein